jgi:hypothetical protein
MNGYIVESQKTYKGKTAGGWLKAAEVADCRAGMTYIWVTIPGDGDCQLLRSDDDMVITNYYGIVVVLATSMRAYCKLKALEARAEQCNLRKVEQSYEY